MKKVVSVQEVDGEGLVGLLGENVLVMCANYFYAGKLAGVNDTCIVLENASIVYETGPLSGKTFTDAQPLPGDWYIQMDAIESFGVSGR